MERKDFLEQTLYPILERMRRGLPLTRDFSTEDFSLLYSLGHSLYTIGDYRQSKLIFQRLVIAFPLERKNWLAYGGALQMSGDYEEALTAWSMAALLDDLDPLPHFHAAECLFSLNQPEEGEKALVEAENKMDDSQGDLMQKISALRRSWNQVRVGNEF